MKKKQQQHRTGQCPVFSCMLTVAIQHSWWNKRTMKDDWKWKCFYICKHSQTNSWYEMGGSVERLTKKERDGSQGCLFVTGSTMMTPTYPRLAAQSALLLLQLHWWQYTGTAPCQTPVHWLSAGGVHHWSAAGERSSPCLWAGCCGTTGSARNKIIFCSACKEPFHVWCYLNMPYTVHLVLEIN